MKRIITALLTGALLCISALAFAQTAPEAPSDYPLFSLKRLAFGVRTEYTWWQDNGGSTLVLPFKKEFGIGIPMAYALTAKRYAPTAEYPSGHVGPPTLSLTARAVYFVDSRVTNYAIGLNLGLYDGGR